jgi:hypothetical protein
MNNMYSSKATIKYKNNIQVVAELDQNISDYYRSLIPKYYYAKPQKAPAHITIVRKNKETPTKMEFWGKHEGRIITFQYEPIIQTDGIYFWMNAYISEIGYIRQELGLPQYRDDRLYGGIQRNEYHITIANTKAKQA